ncbi:MAG: hypothetical protein AAFR04_04775 [Pseudomonadota bacterium]
MTRIHISPRARRAALAIAVIMCVAGSSLGTAVAADCNVRLTPNDGYRELARKLACMNDKIKRLEALIERQAGQRDRPARARAGQPGPAPRAGASAYAAVVHQGLRITLQACGLNSQRRGNYYCAYTVENPTNTDRKMCLSGARVVTQTGQILSRRIRHVVGSTTRSREACDVVPAGVRARASIAFAARGVTLSSLQLVRVRCGARCVLENRNVSID